MIFRKLFLALLLLWTCIAVASTTIVTVTVTDPNGQLFKGGTYRIDFRPVPGNVGPYTVNGVPFTTVFTGTLDATGTFVVTLTDNTTIQPSGSSWSFNICSNSTAPCFTSIKAVSGPAMNLSAAISADAPAIFVNPFPSIPHTYADAQVHQVAGIGGGIYVNITDNTLRYSPDGVNWIVLGASAGGCIPGGINGSVQVKNGTSCNGDPGFVYNPSGTASQYTAVSSLFPASPSVYVGGDDTAGIGANLLMSGNLSLNTNPQFLWYTANGAMSAPTTSIKGDIIGTWNVNGYDGTNFITSSQIIFPIPDTVSPTHVPGGFTVNLASATLSPQPKFSIGDEFGGTDLLLMGDQSHGNAWLGVTFTSSLFPEIDLAADTTGGSTAVPVLKLLSNLGNSQLNGNVINLTSTDGGQNGVNGHSLEVITVNSGTGFTTGGAGAGFFSADSSAGTAKEAIGVEVSAKSDDNKHEHAIVIDQGNITTPICTSSIGSCGNRFIGGTTIAAGATTVTVSTTYVTASSIILVSEDSSIGTLITATCNTTLGRTYAVTARTAGTSFVITSSAAPSVTPACLSFMVIN